MPRTRFLLMLICVLFAAGVTVWLLNLGSPALMVAALPAMMIGAVAIWVLRR